MRRFAAVGLIAVSALACYGQKRPITEKDLLAFHWIGDTQVSPDGSRAAFVETRVAANHEGYETAIYLLDLKTAGAQPVELLAGPHDGSPRWSPDGKTIAFVRAATQDGKTQQAQVYLKTVDSEANPVRISDLPKGAGGPEWSPKGDALVVMSETAKDQDAAKREAARVARSTGDDAHVSDVRVINREVYRFNGAGYVDATTAAQIYLISLPKPDGTQAAAWQLTGGRFGVDEFTWAPDGKRVYYTQEREEESYYDAFEHNSIYGISVEGDAKGLAKTEFTADLKIAAHGISVSRDGKRIAFHAAENPEKPVSHQQDDLWVMELKGGAPRNLTGTLSYEMGSGVGGDNTAPRGGGRAEIVWSEGDGSLTMWRRRMGARCWFLWM